LNEPQLRRIPYRRAAGRALGFKGSAARRLRVADPQASPTEGSMTDEHEPPTTTDAGIPASSDDYSLTVGPDGPILLQDHYVIQKMAQFNRERVPERIVHAKGGGAHGFFEVTEDVREWTSAAFLSKVGKQTPMFARFSTVAGELGSPDTARDPRGFSMKFYTEEGNYDIVGNNTPVFFIRDPQKFSDFIHSQKRMPDTNRRSNDAQWDFWTLTPESAHQVTILMSDRGTPRSWRHMNGYGSHTFMWVNAAGERFWVKYHFKTEQGIQNFTAAEAQAMAGADPDFHRRDLFDSIRRGEYPAWKLEMQIMPFEDAAAVKLGTPAVGVGVGTGAAVLAEIIMTFFLMYSVFGVAVDQRGAKAIAGLVIGLTITMNIFVGGGLTGAAMNPARWFGPALVQGAFDNWWICWVGPIVGATLAAVVWNEFYLSDASTSLPHAASTETEQSDVAPARSRRAA
jgi:hypothetical protein